MLVLMLTLSLFANSSISVEYPDLTMQWIGLSVLIIFVIGYYFIAAEETYHLDKAKPALFIGTLSFMLIGIYYSINGLDLTMINTEVEHLLLEIAGIFFFLFVAMTYIETLLHMNVFNSLKYSLVSKGYSFKKLFWLTGILAFFISPIADNLTTALILSTVLVTISKDKKFLVPGAINIVVAANAGGAWSPFGDITTLMVWTSGHGQVVDFLYLFPASILGYLVTAYLLYLFVPKGKPDFDATTEKRPQLQKGAKVVMFLGVTTILSAVLGHQFFHLPAAWGMMFGLSLLMMYSYFIKVIYGSELNIFSHSMTKIENNTLLFFFGILAAVGALYFVGWLALASSVYHPDILGITGANIAVGFLSAIVDNVPVMSAVLKSNLDMGIDQWMLVTLTAGIGGSLIAFGSAAGVGVMGKMKGIYTFSSHMKLSWTVLVGYMVSVAVWYFQYQILNIGI
jgi:Na+/H+ antiporter NhaD/arsenite permease-like protein